MKKILLFPPMALALTVPAHATGGLLCRTAGTRPIELSLVIAHTAVPSIVSARLNDNGRPVEVNVAQSWLEPSEVRLDLVGPNAIGHEARLNARKNGEFYDGTVWRSGRPRWIRCRES